LLSCSPEAVREEFNPTESHRQYRNALEILDLKDTVLGRTWIDRGDEALSDPVPVVLPVREEVFFDPAEPSAVSYGFSVERGRRILIEMETEMDRYFADVFRRPARDGEIPVLVASRGDRSNRIEFEPRRSGRYILRIQPELLRGGRISLRITFEASLAFPVNDAGPGDILSFFGDPRDGGRRDHHGLDIFAERGQDVVAAADGRIIRTGTRNLGGNIVVLLDEERNLLLYYAHLDEHRTVRGRAVRAGDVIGTVGNTGNASSTPPHLHFGIYLGSWRKPADPWNYLVHPPDAVLTEPDHSALLGEWGRLREDTRLVAAPSASDAAPVYPNRNPRVEGAGDSFTGAAAEPPLSSSGEKPDDPVSLPGGLAVRVLGATGPYLRIRAPFGSEGFVLFSRVDFESPPVSLNEDRTVRDIFSLDPLMILPAGTEVRVIGSGKVGTVAVLPSGRVVFL